MASKLNLGQLVAFLLAAAASLTSGLSTLTFCPTNISASPSLCVQDFDRGTSLAAVLSSTNSSNGIGTITLDVSGKGIDSIANVPPTLWPSITVLYVASCPFPGKSRARNLRQNNFSTLSDLLTNCPSSVESLDLGFNRFTALENVRWEFAFPRLRTLLLNGNNISTLKNVTFPPSLQTLDLSDNPLFTVEMSRITFNQLSTSMNLKMHTLQQKDTGLFQSMCTDGEVLFIATNALCVANPPSESSHFWGCVKTYGLLGFLVMSVVGLYFLPRQPHEARGLRGTFLSSGDEASSPTSVFGTMNTPSMSPPCH
ncbi:Aste57867_1918 [Aphanomyces stellatus]|uniref:Aste57867_1918 protein n=1 Tax=Aphanomyces stellatus TaxID=120398 RepID=A0A485K8Y4_9STRA|nr:hypothetical protein As57867_001916 [Aphanomyces stellatus]VFT79123.1 Aste57867_1918 [Aphanomyces stellatus]